MSDKGQSDNVLLSNRRAFSGRQSMDALINYARYHTQLPRDQDGKIANRFKQLNYSRFLGIAIIVGIPGLYFAQVLYGAFSLSYMVFGETSTVLVSWLLLWRLPDLGVYVSISCLKCTSRRGKFARSSWDSRIPYN